MGLYGSCVETFGGGQLTKSDMSFMFQLFLILRLRFQGSFRSFLRWRRQVRKSLCVLVFLFAVKKLGVLFRQFSLRRFAIRVPETQGGDLLSPLSVGIELIGSFVEIGVLYLFLNNALIILGQTKVAPGNIIKLEVSNLFYNPSAAALVSKILALCAFNAHATTTLRSRSSITFSAIFCTIEWLLLCAWWYHIIRLFTSGSSATVNNSIVAIPWLQM